MKKINYILISLVVLTTAISCNEDKFLEEQPKTIYTTSNAFDKSSQVDAQLITAYQAAYAMFGYGMESTTNASVANFLGGIGSDYSDIYTELAGNGASGWSNYANWTTVDDRFNNIWNAFYKMISYTNLALKGAENVEWEQESEKEYAVAQAKFFRGYAYLRLAELFGGVPIVEEFIETLKLDYVRASRTETYEFAIKDLKDAADLLPDYPKQDGRIAKGVAQHYLAEAYLALGIESGETSNYQKAIDAALVTINLHPLMTERFGSRANPDDASSNNGVKAYKSDGNVFYDLFQLGNYDYSAGNTEAVWTIQCLDYDSYVASGFGAAYGGYASHFLLSGYYSLTYFVGPIFRDMKWNATYQETDANACPFDGNVDTDLYPGKSNSAYLGGMSIGRVYPTNYLIDNIWEGELKNDLRNDPVNICRNFICLDRDHSMYGKVVTREMLAKPLALVPISSKIAMQDEWGWHSSESALHQKQYGRDWYAVRSSETYLLLAEAYLRNNQADQAVNAINTVRNRSKCSKLFTSGEVDIYTILDERARELQYEERRWATLLRMGSKGENDIMKNQLMNHAMYVNDIPYFSGTIGWTLLPIPKTVIDMNTRAVIEQNPGWQ